MIWFTQRKVWAAGWWRRFITRETNQRSRCKRNCNRYGSIVIIAYSWKHINMEYKRQNAFIMKHKDTQLDLWPPQTLTYSNHLKPWPTVTTSNLAFRNTLAVAWWVEGRTRNRSVVSSSPYKGTHVTLSRTMYNHRLVLVGSEFECNLHNKKCLFLNRTKINLYTLNKL